MKRKMRSRLNEHSGGQQQEKPVAQAGDQRRRSGQRGGSPRRQRHGDAPHRGSHHAAQHEPPQPTLLVEWDQPAEQQRHDQAHGDVGDVERHMRVEARRRKPPRAGERERRPRAGTAICRHIAPRALEERAAAFSRRCACRCCHDILSFHQDYSRPKDVRRERRKATKAGPRMGPALPGRGSAHRRSAAAALGEEFGRPRGLPRSGRSHSRW